MFEEARKELGSYLALKKECDFLESKIKKIRNTITSIGSNFGAEIVDGGNPKSRASLIAEMVDYEDEWCKLLRDAEMKCIEIKRKIDNISQINKTAALVLELKFINGYTVERISVTINYAYRQTWHYINDGLRLYSNYNIKKDCTLLHTKV